MQSPIQLIDAFLRRLYRILISLKFAVLVIGSLALSLAVATIVESEYDTATAQYWVYRTVWFYGLLALLGAQIFFVAVSRWPWKWRHFPFLLAHLGILILLWGSWLTDRIGLDGSLRFTEKEQTSAVDLYENVLVLADMTSVNTMPMKWLPPNATFKPFDVADRGMPYSLRVEEFISRADPVFNFVDREGTKVPGVRPTPAAKLRLVGGPMRLNQEVWLWAGDPGWARTSFGPTRFSIGTDPGQPENMNRVELLPQKDGGVEYIAYSPRGKTVRGKLVGGKVNGAKFEPDWKGLVLTIEQWIPDAQAQTSYKPARVQYGQVVPPSAIRLVAKNSKSGAETPLWLGLGDRATVQFEDRAVDVGYFPKRVALPFQVRLDRFTIEHNPGTRDPASYSSMVTVLGPEGGNFQYLIRMNEPLEYMGYTLYQASYEPAEPRPVTSILSVNRDPGRYWKYWGSLLIVLGTITLFAVRYKRSKKVAEAIPL